MGEFLVEVAGQTEWAIPVAIVLWFVARRVTTVARSTDVVSGSTVQATLSPWRRAIGLVAAAALLVGLMVGLGWLITSVITPIVDLDVAIVEWFAANRNDPATLLAQVVDPIGNTPGIIAMVIIAATVAHAVTRRWAAAFIVVIAAAGETSIFLATQSVISRARPDVERLAADPATTSFPSGHVAATIAAYGCIALLVFAWSRSALRVVAIVVAVGLSLLVAWARMYQGMHFPSDVLASFVFAPLWLAACWWAFRPEPRGESLRLGVTSSPGGARA